MSISLNKVQFSYSDAADKPVLDIPYCSVLQGEQVFIYGPSGCGKSTLLNLLSGMLRPEKGEVSVLEQRLDCLTPRQRDRFRADYVGYVFQQFNLIPYLSAVDNVRLAHHFSKRGSDVGALTEIEHLLTQLNIPQDDRLKPIAELSIGQQQRVAIARALINKPEILIADEPTSSLDQKNRDNFMSVLMSLANQHNITLVFVSHDMSLSRYFKRVDALSGINQVSEKD